MWLVALVAAVLAVGRPGKPDIRLEQLREFPVFARTCWVVPHKSGRRVKFALNAAQRIVHHEKQRMRESGRPVRIKVLKMRQGGLSTYFCGTAQHEVMYSAGRAALSISDKLEAPRQWLRRGKGWHRQTPEQFRPHLAASNAVELYYDLINSRYAIATQAGQTPGMSLTFQHVHASECSNWADPEKVLGDLLPAVPKLPETTVVFESTGELVGDYWYDQVMVSLQGGDDFVLVFLPWFICEDYLMRADFGPESYSADERALVGLAEKWALEHPEHARIAGFAGVTPEHVAFRRWVIANEFKGDADMFRSKYPASVQEAFLSVGNLAVPVSVIREHCRTARAPERRVVLSRVGGDVVMGVAAEDEPHWRLYELPEEFCEYAMGGDVAEGALVDPKAPRGERDSSAAVILNRRSLRTSAVFVGQVPPDEFGRQMFLAGELYNEAYLAPEVNGPGLVALGALRDYPNLLLRPGAGDDWSERDLNKLGWKTTPVTRDAMIDDWIAACRPDPMTGFAGRVVCLSSDLVAEEQTFIRTKTGRREHRSGCHDDVLFAAMVAWQVHVRCPHERRTPYARRELSEDALALGVPAAPAYALAGGLDDWDPGEGEEE